MSIRKSLAVLLTAGTVVAFGLSAKPAHADIVPTLIGQAPGTGTFAGDTIFTYNVNLDGSTIIGGPYTSYFTVYDINGLPSSTNLLADDLSVAGNLNGLTIAPTIQLTGITPGPPVTQSPGDDPAKPNITFTLSKASTVSGPIATLFTFSFADTLSGTSDLDYYTSLSENKTNTTPQGNTGFLQLPTGSGFSSTPEPASYAAFVMGGLGLLGLGLKARRRQNIA